MNILVVDVGTSSLRGVLLDNNCITLLTRQIKYQPTYGKHGTVTQAPEDWLSAIKTICTAFSARAPIDAIAITSQRSSIIPADSHGTPLYDAIMWQDTRNSQLIADLQPNENRVRQLCGSGLNTVFSGGKIAWLKQNHPACYSESTYMFTIPGYLFFHLTGEHKLDYTYGSRSMLMDIRKHHWSDELLNIFGLDKHKLGELVPPSSVVGTVTAKFAADTGISVGIPVITCGGDQQCGALGQGVFLPDFVSINLGTGAYLIRQTATLPDTLTQGVTFNAAAVPGEYILESSVLTCGAALDGLLDLINRDVSFIGYALSKSPPGANGLIVLPYFQGTSAPEWNGNAKGAFYGLTLGTTPEDLVRGLLEAICIEIGKGIRIDSDDATPTEIRLGGGLSKTPELCQLLADVTGLPVRCFDNSNATVRGAWMSAAVSLGIAGSWSAAWDLAKPVDSRIYDPTPSLAKLYEALQLRSMELYRATKE